MEAALDRLLRHTQIVSNLAHICNKNSSRFYLTFGDVNTLPYLIYIVSSEMAPKNPRIDCNMARLLFYRGCLGHLFSL